MLYSVCNVTTVRSIKMCIEEQWEAAMKLRMPCIEHTRGNIFHVVSE